MHKAGPGFYLPRLPADLAWFRSCLESQWPSLGSAMPQQGHPYLSVWKQTLGQHAWRKGHPRFRALQPAEAKVKVIQSAGHTTEL